MPEDSFLPGTDPGPQSLRQTQPASAGVVVNVQAHVRGRGWVVFASPRTDSKGRFTARYRFRDTTRTTRYRIRAITRLDTGAPFLANTSRAARITVKP